MTSDSQPVGEYTGRAAERFLADHPPPTDASWVEFDRVQWLHDNLPDTADALARLITEDHDAE